MFSIPIVEIKVAQEEDLSEKQKIAIGNEVCNILIRAMPGLPKEAVSVIFDEYPAKNWITGGIALTDILKKERHRNTT